MPLRPRQIRHAGKRIHCRSVATTVVKDTIMGAASCLVLVVLALLAGSAVAFHLTPHRMLPGTRNLPSTPPAGAITDSIRVGAPAPVALGMTKSDIDTDTDTDTNKIGKKEKKKQSHTTAVPTQQRDPDDETTEKVFGAEFFGGNKQKEELFDPVAEERAAELLRQEREAMQLDGGKTSYRRFDDAACFPDDGARELARRLQAAANGALYEEDEVLSDVYAPDVAWTTPLSRAKESRTPLDELTNALGFYNRIDLAIVGARTLPSSSKTATNGGASAPGTTEEMEIRWEISVVWPNLWEARVLLTGTSRVTVDCATSSIRSQTDRLDGGGPDGTNVVTAIGSQVTPRFWDAYHIGMTPSAELVPRIAPTGSSKKGLLSGSYEMFELPPRLVVRPTLLDLGGREDRVAQSVPNHSFSTIIKTTGPNKQRYVPTSPVEVAISRDKDAGAARVTWSIPIPPEVLAAAGSEGELPLPAPDVETPEDRMAESTYMLQPRRLVATVPYGGNPQDEDVSEVRKGLYEAVTKDGLRPKLDGDGRPSFFFLQNDAKACYVSDGGLGMAVYEWRPKFVKGNEVGIELEM